MAPEQSASLAELARLRQEVRDSRGGLDRAVADVRQVLAAWTDAPPDRVYLVFLAAALHTYYTALESAIERVARQLDRAVPTGDRWHQDLLSQAMVEIPGIRPPVLAADLHEDLRALLSFRHFFRNAYAVELDPARLADDARRLVRVAPRVAQALDDLDEFLARTMASLS